MIQTLYFHQSDFYVRRILFINSASIFTVFFPLIQLSLKHIFFISPFSIYAVLFSFIQLPFLDYSFYHSSFYVYSIPFITPPSIYTVFVSLLQLFFKLIISFNKFHFCQHKAFCSSFRLVSTQRISLVNQTSI